ncbi:hypothetical protein ACFLSQ_06215 [Bacteroidota bacterium]
MKVNIKHYNPDEPIPVRKYLRNKKLVKYFNRETAAGIVCLYELTGGENLNSDIPFYYETGLVEFEDYGLDDIVKACTENDKFSQQAFVEKGLSSISPLTQFKILLNMPPSFISIENGLSGDNAVIYSSASGLLIQALNAPVDSEILLGSGKVYSNGTVDSGFAIVSKSELSNSTFLSSNHEAIEIFKDWYRRATNE